jgi:hypothetical protein
MTQRCGPTQSYRNLEREVVRLRSALTAEIVECIGEQWECRRCGATAPVECDVSKIGHVGGCPLASPSSSNGEKA